MIVSENEEAGIETTNEQLAATFKVATRIDYYKDGKVVGRGEYATASVEVLASSIGNASEGTSRALDQHIATTQQEAE